MKESKEFGIAPKKIFIPLLLSLPFVAIILSISYPGFMSYDPIHMIREARGTVEGGIYPTLPVYIFRLFDVFGNGNELLFVTQVLLMYFLMNLIVWLVTASWRWVLGVSLVFTLSPVLFGAVMVLWKDVTLTVLFLIAATIIFLRSREKVPSRVITPVLKWLAFAAIFLTAGMRLNALPLSIALLIYWIRVYYPNISTRKLVALATVVSISLLGFTQFLGAVRLPDLGPLEPSTNVYALMATDLFGMSKFAESPLVPFDSKSSREPKMEKSEIEAVYSNFGVLVWQNNAAEKDIEIRIYPKTYVNSDIPRAWVSAIQKNTPAYIAYRADLMSAIIGVSPEKPYEPTHYNTIDENDLGIEFTMRWQTLIALAYVWLASGFFFFKPWFYLTISALALLGIRKRMFRGEFRNFSLFLFATGVAYLAPYLFIAPSGEVRYTFPSTVLFLIATSIAFWVRWNPSEGGRASI